MSLLTSLLRFPRLCSSGMVVTRSLSTTWLSSSFPSASAHPPRGGAAVAQFSRTSDRPIILSTWYGPCSHQYLTPYNRQGQQQQQLRYKHGGKGAKMGQHLKTLDELAHAESRAEAQERRQRQKDKKAARKGKKQEGITTSASSSAADLQEEDHDHHDEEEHEDEHEEGVLPDIDVVKGRMKKVVDKFAESLKAIRGAEPTPELLEDIQVNAYGTQNPLKSVAQVVIVSPTLASVTCFDPAVAKEVSRALQVHMGLNPSIEDGGVVRVPLPRVSMESRQATAAQLGKRTESYRKKIRSVRQKALHVVKPGVAGKLEGISKDDAFRVQKVIEVATEDAISKLNALSKEKNDAIMAV